MSQEEMQMPIKGREALRKYLFAAKAGALPTEGF
jgi:hypothetical protein